MTDYDMNVYYNPEKHGLTPVAEYEYSSGMYEFDTRVIWRHQASGALYMARDSLQAMTRRIELNKAQAEAFLKGQGK